MNQTSTPTIPLLIFPEKEPQTVSKETEQQLRPSETSLRIIREHSLKSSPHSIEDKN